jgi:hypothetical protein
MGVVVGKVGGREQTLTGALKLCLHAPAPALHASAHSISAPNVHVCNWLLRPYPDLSLFNLLSSVTRLRFSTEGE